MQGMPTEDGGGCILRNGLVFINTVRYLGGNALKGFSTHLSRAYTLLRA